MVGRGDLVKVASLVVGWGDFEPVTEALKHRETLIVTVRVESRVVGRGVLDTVLVTD